MKNTIHLLLGLASVWTPLQAALVVNDGSTITGLAVQATTAVPANWSIASDGSVLTVSANNASSNKGVAYATDTGPSSVWTTPGAYAFSADVKPATANTNNRVGVLGWYDTTSKIGISLYTRSDQFRLRTFDIGTGGETFNNLFTTAGAAYSATNFLSGSLGNFGGFSQFDFIPINYELSFSAPTADDLVALPTATARITATVTQPAMDDGLGHVTVGATASTIVLTNLAMPTDANHRFGYFGYGPAATTAILATYDNLVVVPEPGILIMGMAAVIMILCLLRRQS